MEFSLVRHLLEIKDGRSEVFSEWAAEIRRLDEMPPAATIAGYWALLEKQIQHLEQESMLSIISYEHLCMEGERYLVERLEQTDSSDIENLRSTLNQDSATTDTSRRNASVHKRVHGWRDELTERDRDNVMKALQMVDAVNLLPELD